MTEPGPTHLPPPPPKPRRRKPFIVVGVVLFLIAVLLLVAQPIASAYLEKKLKATLAPRFDAELDLGRVTYAFPFGARVGRSKLTARDPDGKAFEILSIDGLDVEMKRIPFHSGPLIIKSVKLYHPTVHLIRTPEGFAGINAHVRHKPRDKNRPERKLSEVLELRQVTVSAGGVTYEDRTQPGFVPLVWKGIDVDLGTEPKSHADYGFALDAKAGSTASVSAKGSVNIDTLDLKLDDSQLALSANPDATEAAVPPKVQQELRKYGVKGDLKIQTKGTVPVKDIDNAAFTSNLLLTGASATVPGAGATLDQFDFSLQCKREPRSPLFAFVFSLKARAGGSSFEIGRGTFSVDPVKKTFTVDKFDTSLQLGPPRQALPTTAEVALDKFDVRGRVDLTFAASGPIVNPTLDNVNYDFILIPHAISAKLPGFPEYLTEVGGSVTGGHGVIKLENVAAKYGNDFFHLSSARVPVEDFRRYVHVNEIVADAALREPAPPLPEKVQRPLDLVRPTGQFFLAGNALLDRTVPGQNKVDYAIQISSDTAAATPTKYRFPVTGVKLDAFLNPERFELRRLDATVFGGRLEASGRVYPFVPLTFQAETALKAAELQQVVNALHAEKPGDAPKASGRTFVNMRLSGSNTPQVDLLSSLKAKGSVEIVDGDLWSVPIVRGIADSSPIKGALSVGEAAAVFDVADKKVIVKNAALNSPLLGVQMSGTVGFDGNCNLRAIAAPLADWREQLRNTRIPIFGEVAGQFLGVMQKVLNSATKQLLYQVQISGPTTKPRVTPIPAPALTDTIARVFGGMIKSEGQARLLDSVKDPNEK